VGLGAHATGLRSVIDELTVVEEGAEVTVLRITDRQQPYSFLSADGTVLSQRPGKPAQTRDVRLVNTADGWRIAQITTVS
nr:hypothetical protein [Micromonospora sp. DSM 115978]